MSRRSSRSSSRAPLFNLPVKGLYLLRVGRLARAEEKEERSKRVGIHKSLESIKAKLYLIAFGSIKMG